MRSISEYITEQETGVVLESGDTMVRGYIEFASAASLVNYYAEQASLVCFADENGFIMESDGILSKIGGGIKSAWDGFIKFIKGLLGKLAGFFKGKQLAKAENDLASLDQNQEITVEYRILYPYAILGVCKTFGDKANLDSFDESAGMSALVRPISDLNKEIDDFTNGNDPQGLKRMVQEGGGESKYEVLKDGRVVMTIGQFRTLVKELNGNKIKMEMDKIQHEIDTIDKKMKNAIAELKGDADKAFKDPSTAEVNGKNVFVGIHHDDDPDDDFEAAKRSAAKNSANKAIDKASAKGQAAIKALNTFTKHLSKMYDQCIQQYQTVASDVTKMLKTSAPGGTSNNKIGRPADATVSVEAAYLV